MLDALLERFGSAANALKAETAELMEVPFIGPKVARNSSASLEKQDVEEEIALLADHKVRMICRGTPAYPPTLANIPGAPPLLFVRGTLHPQEEKCIGLVGSRTCTSLGKRWVERMAKDFVQAGLDGRERTGARHRRAMPIMRRLRPADERWPCWRAA